MSEVAAEKLGVKETKEAIVGLVMLGVELAKLAKDGVDLSDAVALVAKSQDEEFRKIIVTAAQGIERVPAEIKDLTLAEIVEIAQVIPVVLSILADYKKA